MLNNICKIIFLLFFLSCADDNSLNSDNNELEDGDTIFGDFNNLNIVTWNIEHFPKSDQSLQYIEQAITLMNVDIIVLQEIESTIYFNELISLLGDNWLGYRYENSDWGELSFLINTNHIEHTTPYSILNAEEYYFAYRPPYVLEFSYNNQDFLLINVHYKCCGDGSLDEEDNGDEEYRRLRSSFYLDNYISENLNNENVIILGDFNDELIDLDNVFNVFLENPDEYLFTDFSMAEQNNYWQYWSYPSWPSHLDHIIISNELFDDYEKTTSSCNTILVDEALFTGWENYDEYISDHRPVGISLDISQ